MLFDIAPEMDPSLHLSRRKELLTTIKQEYKMGSSDILFLTAGFERDSERFRQEGSFFYLTGIREPGVVLIAKLDGATTLYVPNCMRDRTKWMYTPVSLTPQNAQKVGVNKIEHLGDECYGYCIEPFFSQNEYKTLLAHLKDVVDAGGKVFTLNPNNTSEYVEQRLVLERIKQFVPGLSESIVDISKPIAQMRRKKDMHEIQRTYEAINVTLMAHETAAQSIKPDISEREIQGVVEYVFTAAGARTAFPSVIASGINGTVLHYDENNGVLKDGDLLVVDIGAEVGHYCADITRTYPVSGKFTKRQRELYDVVLETQAYIEDIAKPGMWLSNKEEPDKSLSHLAKKFLAAKGLEKYFTHGIGHFLGLDVHDVGDHKRPLEKGDMFTIEPGVYIKEEGIGIRIEDNYLMGNDGVICLSEELPKTADEIEKFMKENSPAENAAGE